MNEEQLRAASEFLFKLAGIGVRVNVSGDRVTASPGAKLKPWMLQRLKQYKPAIFALDAEYRAELIEERKAIEAEGCTAKSLDRCTTERLPITGKRLLPFSK